MDKNGNVTSGAERQVDLSPLFHRYENKWVALTEYTPHYKVICYGKDAAVVHGKAIKKGYKNPVMFKVSPDLLNAIF
ncbi:MAG TPA: hypothetical protein PLQ76_02785 [bacterium]|nr:hypothetical protein [bacterium]